jgi:ATP-dependent DNA ligase
LGRRDREATWFDLRASPLKAVAEDEVRVVGEFLVGGFTDPQGKRVGLGALLVGYNKDDDFVFAGKIGTDSTPKLLLELREQLDQLEIPKAPFTKAIGLPRLRAHWVQPKIEVESVSSSGPCTASCAIRGCST